MSSRRFKMFFLIGLALFALLAIWLVPLGKKESQSLLVPNNPMIVAAGEEIYAAQCASCHGANLEGEEDWQTRDADGYLPAPPHDENGHTWHHTDQALFRLTKFGLAKLSGLENYKTRMPAYEGELTDEEIIAVLSFVKSKWPEEVQRRHDQVNQSANRKNQ